MTDAEYEELRHAAIAMGQKPVRLTENGSALLLEGVQEPWNPLKDDGVALRLAVKLAITDLALVVGRYVMETHPEGDDIYAITRRAITRAAAEIGKQMGGGNV